MTPLRKDFIDKYIGHGQKYQVKVSRVNINTGALHFVSNYDCSQDRFRNAVQDSCCIPLAMQPRHVYFDGGLREVIPLNEAVKDGHEDINIILCNPWKKDPWNEWNFKSTKPFLRFIHLAIRALDGVMNHEVMNNDIFSVLYRIENLDRIKIYMPSDYLYDTLEFDKKKIAYAIEEGYRTKPITLRDIVEMEGLSHV
jgi:NTE family protein